MGPFGGPPSLGRQSAGHAAPDFLRRPAVRSDDRIPPKGTRETSFLFPYTGSPDFVVEAKLYYRYPVALAKPEEIRLEMGGATRSAR